MLPSLNIVTVLITADDFGTPEIPQVFEERRTASKNQFKKY
jgi:hypothetical protein